MRDMKQLLMIFFLSSCAISKPTPEVIEKIHRQHWAGIWKRNTSSTLTIWCNGAFKLEDVLTYTNLNGSGKEQGGYVQNITSTELVTGITHTIEKRPYLSGSKWEVSLDENTWTKAQGFDC